MMEILFEVNTYSVSNPDPPLPPQPSTNDCACINSQGIFLKLIL